VDADVAGVVIANVEQRSAAAVAGLRQGDIITMINDSEIESLQDFYSIVGQKDQKDFEIHFLRDSVQLRIGITRL
ncbi:MAG: PDZ domain-containing protein, partial [Spirochaetaceae bacterium]